MAQRQTADMPDEAAVSDCDELWTTDDTSAFLRVPVPTLWHWSHVGTGPRVFKVGRHLRYDPADVRRWLVETCDKEISR